MAPVMLRRKDGTTGVKIIRRSQKNYQRLSVDEA